MKKSIKLMRNITIALVAMTMLWINERYIKNIDSITYSIIMTIAVTLLATSIVYFLNKKLFGNDIEELISDRLAILKDCQKYGLYSIDDKFPLDDEIIKNDFLSSKKVYIVMNDGKSLVSSNRSLFLERVNKSNLTTTFILQDYDQDDTMSALTRKNGHSENKDYYVNKIKDFINYHLKNDLKCQCNKNHNLFVHLNPNYNTLGIILMDNFAMMSIYRISPGKTSVPHFVFTKNLSEYENIVKDVNQIVNISKKVDLT